MEIYAIYMTIVPLIIWVVAYFYYKYEMNQMQETDVRIAEITRELKRRGNPAE
ncbi:hypothetical protein [Phyllobacterium sp. P5_D12]